MAACGSLDHIFEKPLPENPTLLESLSPWKHIKSMKPIRDSSCTELFGEFHFKEEAQTITTSTSFDEEEKNKNYSHEKQSDSFSSMNSESLSLCTEGLGFESFDDVEDVEKYDDVCNNEEERESITTDVIREMESKKTGQRGEFPPPISSIGKSGKPWVCFKSFRENGRFILKEMRIPTQEFLHACRENGRLKLRFIQSDVEEDEDEEEDEEEEEFEDTIIEKE